MKKMHIILLLLLLCWAAGTHAQYWTPTGGPGAGSVQALLVIANDTVIAGTARGPYSLPPNGAAWSPSSLTDTITSLTRNATTVFAGGLKGVYRSSAWQQTLFARIYSLTTGTSVFAGGRDSIYGSTNNGLTWSAPRKVTNGIITSLTVSGTSVFAGMADSGVWRSDDGGNQWFAVNAGLSSRRIHALAFINNILFAGTESGIFRTTNSGTSWIASGISNLIVWSFAVNAMNHIFAGTAGGIFVSTDNGVNWIAINSGLTDLANRSLAVDGAGVVFAGEIGGEVFKTSRSTTIPPGASATGGTLTCTTTSVVLSATSSAPRVSFNWAAPGGDSTCFVSVRTTPNPRVRCTGTYTVTVTDSINGLTSTAAASVIPNTAQPGANALGGVLNCTTTSVVLSATSPTGGVNFSWSGPGIVSGSNTPNPRVSASGTYTVTVTNSVNGCTSTATAAVNQNVSAPGASATGGTLTCVATAVVLTAATTTGTSFGWNGPSVISGGNTANPTVNAAGTYTVTVTNSANGCTSTATASVGQASAPPGASATGGQLTCTTTSVVLTAVTTSGTGFSWTGPGIVSGGTTANPRVSASGTYTVTVTNSVNGCTSTATAAVNQNVAAPGASATGGTLTCTSTAVVLTAATTTGTNFSWSGPSIISGNSTANPTVNAPGTYTVTVTNSANGCTSTATASVDASGTPGASATGGTLICTTTSVVLSATSSTPGVSFSWSGLGIVSGGTTANPRVSSSGTYTVTVMNPTSGCVSLATAFVNQNITVPGASATGGNLTCTTTSIVLSATTTTGTSFSWVGSGIVSGGTTANPRVTAAGTYTVTITNSGNGCTSTATASVNTNTAAPGASATGGTLNCTTTLVVLSATTTNGTGFSWSGAGIVSGSNTANPRVSASGTFTVTVTNSAGGCTSTATASVGQTAATPGASATGGTLTCTTTAVVLTAATVTGTSFSWSGPSIISGGSTANPTVNAPGTYTVTVTNSANGCTSTASASVGTSGLPGASATGATLTCTTTSVVLSATSPTAGVSFNWSGPGIVSGGTTANPRVSSSGTYTVTVLNPATGCASLATALVNLSNGVPGASAVGGTLTCTTTSVVISVVTTAGTTFSWAGTGIVSGGSTANPRVSSAGTYTVTVTNSSNGCTSAATASVNNNTTAPGASATGGTLTSTTTAVVLSGTTTSGTGFSWSGPGIVSGGATANPTVSASGTYTVTVVNSANGCTSTATALVTSTSTPPPIVSIPESTSVGSSARVVVSIPQNLILTTSLLYYRHAGDRRYDSLPFARSGPILQVDIPPSYPDLRGIECYILLSDGQITFTYPITDPVNHPAVIRVQVATILGALPTQRRVYTMVSVPLELSDPSPAAVLFDDYGEYRRNLWRLFRWEHDTYVEHPDIFATFTPGVAFWLITHVGVPFDVDEGVSVNSASPYQLTLEHGWNQIADPFAFPVAWDSIANSNLVIGPYFYDGVEFQPNVSVLVPWQGYFVYDSSGSVVLSVPPVSANATLNSVSTPNPVTSSYDFVLQFSAEAVGTELKDTQNFIGFRAEAQQGMDKLDLPEPPPIGEFVQLSIMDAREPYMWNFKPVPTEGETWEVRLRSTLSNQLIHVTINESGDLQSGFAVYVFDLDNGVIVSQSNRTLDIQLGSAFSVRNLRIVIGTEVYAQQHSDGAPLVPTEFRLEQNYPNPFNPETTIRYQLAKRANVVLEVYNMLGQRVRALVEHEQTAGVHTVMWDGHNEAGHEVAAGVYLYRLRAGEFVATRKLALIR